MLQDSSKQVKWGPVKYPLATRAAAKRSGWTFQISTSPATAHGPRRGHPRNAASCDRRGAGRRGPLPVRVRPTGRPGRELLRRSAACSATYATTTTGELWRLGAFLTDDAARRAVERAVGTEEGALW
jgi:hypothetical protein